MLYANASLVLFNTIKLFIKFPLCFTVIDDNRTNKLSKRQQDYEKTIELSRNYILRNAGMLIIEQEKYYKNIAFL